MCFEPERLTKSDLRQIENGPNPSILSSYEDAARTYEMTWAIRLASEKTSEQIRARQK